jgi:O-acetyl-ADP-ribose deacetylase (regulator of RNase III)
MGAGVALAISKKWPFVEKAYQKYLNNYQGDPLGTVYVVQTSEGPDIANLMGQRAVGPGLQTKYTCLFTAIDRLIEYMQEEHLTTVAMPWKIGCGNGGGDWDFVKPEIEKKFFRPDIHLEWRRI